MSAKQAKGKSRITVSLDNDTAQFLRRLRARTRAPSLSACLEALITERKRNMDVELQNQRIRAYYDSTTEREAKEEATWGEFAEGEVAAAKR